MNTKEESDSGGKRREVVGDGNRVAWRQHSTHLDADDDVLSCVGLQTSLQGGERLIEDSWQSKAAQAARRDFTPHLDHFSDLLQFPVAPPCTVLEVDPGGTHVLEGSVHVTLKLQSMKCTDSQSHYTGEHLCTAARAGTGAHTTGKKGTATRGVGGVSESCMGAAMEEDERRAGGVGCNGEGREGNS